MMTVCKPLQFKPIEMDFERKTQLLFQLGYFISETWPDFKVNTRENVSQIVKTVDNQHFQDAVAKFQAFYIDDYSEQFDDFAPVVDGEFGAKTAQTAENIMARRYCMHPDISELGEGLRRWGFMDITYSHALQKLPGVSSDTVHKSYVESWNRWNRICGLKAGFISQVKNANVQAYAKRIDGSGGTLAWSYLPSNSGSGSGKNTELEQRYDTGDRWAGNAAFQLEVMTHENGHAAGLDHDNGRDSNGNRSIMSSAALGIKALNQDDIKKMQDRYGKPVSEPGQPPSIPSDPIGSGVVSLLESNGITRIFNERGSSGNGGGNWAF